MSFETYLVSTAYAFESNSKLVVGGIAKDAAQAAKNLDLLSVAVDRADTAVKAFTASLQGARASFSEFIVGAGRAAVAADDITLSMRVAGRGAATTGAQFGAASKVIGDEVQVAAARVSESATVITSRLGAVTAAAERSAVAMRGIGAAGGGIGGGAGGAAAGTGAGRFGRMGGFAANAGIVGSIAAAGTLALGVRGAAQLQDAEIQTGIPMGRSNQWVATHLRPLAMQMSMRTAQSVTDSMSLLRTMATAGLNDPKALRDLAMPIAEFADTQYLGKFHVPFDESAGQASAMAHQMNLRTSAQMKPFLNTLFKISQDMPDNLRTAATQLKYYGASFTGAGVGASEIVQLQATADRLGYGGGKSGTGLNMILRNLQSPNKTQHAAQAALDMLDPQGHSRFINRKTGQFDPEALFSGLNAKYDVARKTGTVGAFNDLLNHAFVTNAGLIARAFSSDAGRQQRGAVRATMHRIEDLQSAQARLMGSLNNQTRLLTSNFKTLATILGGPLLAPLTAVVSKLASVTGGAALFLSQHPAATGVGSAVLAAAGLFGAYKIARAGLGYGRMFFHVGEVGMGLSRHIGAMASVAEGAEAVAGGAAKGGGLIARAAGVGKGILGAATFGASRTFFTGGLMGLVGDLKIAGFAAMRSRAGWLILGKTLGMIGLRAIPVVGELLTLVQAIQFLGAHSKQIGYGLGYAAGWIAHTGAPMVANAFMNIVKAIIDAVTHPGQTLSRGLSAAQKLLFDARKRVVDTVAGVAKSASAGFNATNGVPQRTPATHQGPTAGMRDTRHAMLEGHGGGIVNGNVIVHVQQVADLTPDMIRDHVKKLLTDSHRKVDRGSIPKSTPFGDSLRTGTTKAGMQFATT